MFKYALCACVAFTPIVATAQETIPPVQTVSEPIAQVSTQNAVLRAGTPVQLRMMEEVTTKKKAAKVGQRFQMEVAAPVIVNSVTVIPSGTPAWGEITNVRNKGMWGKSGKLEARVLYLRVNGRQIRLTGNFDDKGVTGTAAVVGAIALIPVAGFFTTGTSAVLPKGGEVGAFIDEDVELAFKQEKPAPLPVAAPQQAVLAVPVGTVQETPVDTAPKPQPLDSSGQVRCETCR